MRDTATADGNRLVEDWNIKHNVGARVRFWPVMVPVEGDRGYVTTTRSVAELRNGTPTIFLNGYSGYVHLRHVEPVESAEVPPSWAEPFTDLLPGRAKKVFLPDDCFAVEWTANRREWTAIGGYDKITVWVSDDVADPVTVHGIDLATRVRHLIAMLRIRGALAVKANQ